MEVVVVVGVVEGHACQDNTTGVERVDNMHLVQGNKG